MEEKQKVWIRGDKERGDEVIKALEDLGADNFVLEWKGIDSERIYYINHDGIVCSEYDISEYAKIIMDNYKEIKLPEQWKDGYILKSKLLKDTFGVFKRTCENESERFEGYVFVSPEDIETKRPFKKSYRLATPQEIVEFHELLHKHGKHWDTEKKQLVNWSWKPKMDDIYFHIGDCGYICSQYFTENFYDELRCKFGNCFRTREEAEAMAEKIKELLKGNENRKL